MADFVDPFENLFLSRFIQEGFSDNENVRKKVVNYFSSFDDSIIDFKVEKLQDYDEHLKINTVHILVNSDETVTLSLQEESAGTLKMFALYPSLQEVMKTGGVLFVDELSSSLHPLLVRHFLINFLDPTINKNHAQIIFTTHDSWTLSDDLLRRNAVWFTEKDNDGISS